MRLTIFGAGYSGRAIGRAALEQGAQVFGTSRSASKAARLAAIGLQPLLFDGMHLSGDVIGALGETTHLLQSIAPGENGDPLLGLLSTANLKTLAPNLVWIGYLSTVGVYGNHNGAWVDEETPLRPASQRSMNRVMAENGWRGLARAFGLPLAILRLSGIYGPGRNAFINLLKGTARRLIRPGQVFNRVRVEDIAPAAVFLAASGRSGIFNITDDEPAPPQDVIAEAARLMGIAPPPEQPFATAELSPMARSFYAENKRVSNRKIRDLGYRFLYPDYRCSLQQLFHSGFQSEI